MGLPPARLHVAHAEPGLTVPPPFPRGRPQSQADKAVQTRKPHSSPIGKHGEASASSLRVSLGAAPCALAP